MNLNTRNTTKKRGLNKMLAEYEERTKVESSKRFRLKRELSDKGAKENTGRRQTRSSQSKTKKIKPEIKYYVSSDSDEEEHSGITSRVDSSQVNTTMDSKLTDNSSALNASSSSTSRLESSSAEEPSSSVEEPHENTSGSACSRDPEDAANTTAITINSTINTNDFEREIAELLAESDRLIAETSVIDLITPRRSTRSIINLVKSPVAQVIDLTESPVTEENKTNDEERVPDCAICMEQLSNRHTSVTPCGHCFCTNCIKMSLAATKKCPTCRKRCYPKQLYPLFL